MAPPGRQRSDRQRRPRHRLEPSSDAPRPTRAATRRPPARHSRAAAGLLRVGLLGAGLLLALAGAGGVATLLVGVFSASTASGSTLAFASLDSWLPSAVTTSRITASTCQVSWTPHGSAPVGATYDITDGAGTLVSDVAGTTTVVTVGAAASTPVVKLRVGSWVSSSGTAAASACLGWPDAPAVTLAPTEGQAAATWTAPAGNGASVASYSATISPAGTGTSSCSVVVPASRSCVFTGLTDGLSYTVSVTATSSAGTGPAGTATAVPYPSTVMTGSATKLWLDGADSSTLFASSSCSGALASSTLGCWKDKSSSANDAVQTTAGSRPAMSTLNSLSAPAFDGTSSVMDLDVSKLPTGTSPSTVYLVATQEDPSPTTTNHRSALAWGAGANGQSRAVTKYWHSTAAHLDTWGPQGSPTRSWTGGGAANLFDAQLTGTDKSVDLDGAASYTETGSYSTGTTGAWVGNHIYGNWAYWQGRIAEIVVLDQTVSASQNRQVQEYLARKWGLTVTPAAPTTVTVAPTAAGTSADVAWSAPAWNGGSVVTGYTVTAVPAAGGGNVTCTAVHPATSCTLSGLAGGGAQYTVTVAADNVVGTGPASTSSALFAGVPLTTNLKLWLDGADAASMYASSSCSGSAATTAVACWKDKSGIGNDATASIAGTEPARSTVNGFSVPSYDGSNDSLVLTPNLLPTGTTSGTQFAVATLTDPSPGSSGLRSVMNYGTLVGGQARQIQKPASSSARVVSVGTDVTQGTWSAAPGLVGAEFTSTSETIWSDGQSGSTATGLTNNTGTTYARVGSSGTPSQYWYGQVPEVLVYSGTLTTTQRRTVEEYLAAKWGITIAPSVPLTPSAVAGNATASVSWTTPASNGGSAITSYTVTPVGGPGSCTWSAGTTASCTGLTNGTTYTFTVAAVNAVGAGAAATTAAVTPMTVPGAPTAVAATADDTVSSVSWTAPASNGGSAITSYTATAVPSDGTLATKTCSSANSPCSLSGLTNGATYTVSVTATNVIGTGAASSSATVIPYPKTVMSGAGFKLWLDGADSATLFASSGCSGAAASSAVGCWTDKSGTGNNATQGTGAAQPGLTTVAGRSVPSFDGTSDRLVLTPSLLPTGTAAGTQFAVASTTEANPAGSSYRLLMGYGTGNSGQSRSMGKDTFQTAAYVDAWNSGVAQSGSWATGVTSVMAGEFASGQFRVGWAGAPYGPARIYGYNTGTTGAAVGSNLVAADFWMGPISEFLVFSSPLSTADQRTVAEYLARKWASTITPAAPASASATAGNGTATVSFSAPAWNGGAAVSSYTVTPVGGPGSCTWSSGTTASCTGLTNGTSYTFTVAAVNSVGTGPTATTASVTPTGPPGAPTAVGATAADTVSSVSWTAPASDGGSAITSYTATAVPSDGTLATKTCSSATSPCTLSGLTNGALYTVSVTATNAVGTGSASSSTTVTPYPKGIMTGATLNLWLDGADSSTLFASSGCSGAAASTTIGCWKDKSASANDATQATGANQPVLSTMNGRVSPTFDGTDDYTNLTVAKMVTGTNPSGIYVVAAQEDTSPASSCYRHIIGWGSAASGQTRVVEKGCNNSNAFVETYDSWMSVASPPTWPVSSAALINGTVTSSTVSASMNGASAYSISYTNNTGTAAGAQLGQSPWGGGNWKGRVAEVIVLAANPTASQDRQIQEYLARKWGMTITPAAPQSASATPGNTTATVSWSAPAWNGGASVTSYSVTPVGGGGSCTWSSGTTAACTGLTHGASYTFTVSATNSVGAGPTTTTAAVTP